MEVSDNQLNTFVDNFDHAQDGSPGGGSRQLHRQLSSGLSGVSTGVDAKSKIVLPSISKRNSS